MTSPTPAQETVDRLKPYVLDLLGTSQRDQAQQALADTEAIRDAVPGQIAAELDTQVPPRIDAGMDEHAATTASTVAGWTADAVGGRNLSRRRNLAYSSTYQTVVDTGETFWTGETIYHGVKTATSTPPTSLNTILSIEPGETYTISLWVKGASLAAGMNANILFYDMDANKSLRSVKATGTGTDWERIQGTYTNTTGVRHDRVVCYFYLNRNPGEETWFTSPKFERGNQATPWTPAPEDAAAHVQAGNSLDTFPSPFPAHDPALALRVDNSVGTRVFVGDTMIHGDTGWRDIASLLPGSTGSMLLRRTGNVVEFALNNFDNSAGTETHFSLPIGFRVGVITHTLIGDASPAIWAMLANGSVSFGQRKIIGAKHGVWTTSDPWPTTLPGIPA